MTAKRTASIGTRLVASVALFALIATGCGAAIAEQSIDRAVPVTAGDPVIDLGAPAPVPNAAASTIDSASGGSHQYGSSLEEFGDTIRETQGTTSESSNASQSSASDFPTIVWDDLIPFGESGQEIFARYEDQLEAVEIGSQEASDLYREMQAEFDPAAVNTELDGQKIRLAGFVAPLTYEDDIVTEFLLVPNFGACIHVPPPPPNQTVMVTVDKSDGLTPDEAWGAVWVEGTITIDYATTDLAEASYTITSGVSGVYNDF